MDEFSLRSTGFLETLASFSVPLLAIHRTVRLEHFVGTHFPVFLAKLGKNVRSSVLAGHGKMQGEKEIFRHASEFYFVERQTLDGTQVGVHCNGEAQLRVFARSSSKSVTSQVR